MIVTCCCTIFGGNSCNLLYLTTKHAFENFAGGNCLVAHPLIAGLTQTHAVQSAGKTGGNPYFTINYYFPYFNDYYEATMPGCFQNRNVTKDLLSAVIRHMLAACAAVVSQHTRAFLLATT